MPFGWNLQLDNVYGHFVKAHGNKVKLKTFENNETRFNPILQEKNTCACNYHLNMVEGWLQQHLKQKQDVCQNNYIIFQGLINMWTFDLCLVENSNAFRNLKCLKGE